METKINENGEVIINDVVISQEAEEKVGYCLREREQQINDLYKWIGEVTGSDRANDLYLMKEDLYYLESLEDEFVFSSISTNEFIAKSDDEENFNSICKEILELNKKNIIRVRDIAKEINLYGCMQDFKETAFSEFLRFNGFEIVDENEEYADFEYSDCKAYLDLEVKKL